MPAPNALLVTIGNTSTALARADRQVASTIDAIENGGYHASIVISS